MSNCVVTIARGFGSGGRTIGKLLAKRLDMDYYDSELIRLASEESGINLELFGRADERGKVNLFKRYNQSYGEWVLPPDSSDFVSDDNLFNYQAKIMRDLAQKQNCVLIGRCSDYILRDFPQVARVFVYADDATCLRHVTELYGMTPGEAKAKIESINKGRASYYKYYTGRAWNDASNYDLCINTSKLSFEQAVDMIEDYLRIRGLRT
ncbi:MAG: cytidylate kinase-like family protein [Clostridia bacterium]|nr:cytidylate kinase-like family protein [Clostridia bacterium]